MLTQRLFFLLQFFLMTAVAAETYGPIKSGEMLWVIASKVHQATEMTRYQSVIALLHANPDAFNVPCNLNSLKVGAILTIPVASEISLSAAEAFKEFQRQQAEWKAHRQGQTIQCATAPKPPVTTGITTTLPPPVTKTQTTLSTVQPVSDVLRDKPPISEKSTQILELNQWLDYQKLPTLLANQPLGLVIGGMIIMAVGMLLAIFFGWLLHRTVARKSELSYPLVNVSEHFFTETHSPLVAATNAAMEERLSTIRLCLAQGDLQKVPHLLQEVEIKGTAIQQFEARQLAEIYKKITNLQEEFQKTQKLLLSQLTVTNPPATESDTVEKNDPKQGEYLPQRYLPENKEKVFELVDTVMQVLDQELQAQGQLFEAYQQRHQQPIFETDEYQVVKKTEELDELDKKDETLSRQAKSTRYL
jgi:FimV-like protein